MHVAEDRLAKYLPSRLVCLAFQGAPSAIKISKVCIDNIFLSSNNFSIIVVNRLYSLQIFFFLDF